jgi:glucose-1-phosphate cytidylyltransferase
MKAVILAGGLGTRLSEETSTRPKPMVEIGGRPILWHIMKIYAASGVTEFIICCGYKGYMIKEYFANYSRHMADIQVDLGSNVVTHLNQAAEPWKITLIDTGDSSQTGGRLRRVREHVAEEEAFFFTYGDGVADIDVEEQLSFHRAHGGLATITAVQPAGRYGALRLAGDIVEGFVEKPKGDGGLINGGFFVLSPKCIDYISGDQSVWENEALPQLAADGQLHAYRHEGFWQPMDTLRERNMLENLWQSEAPPWKIW